LRLPQFSDILLIDGGKVVSPTHRSLFTSRKILELTFVRGCVDPRAIVWLEGLGKLKNPLHPRLEPATFQLVA
jgi:hypothetical protein